MLYLYYNNHFDRKEKNELLESLATETKISGQLLNFTIWKNLEKKLAEIRVNTIPAGIFRQGRKKKSFFTFSSQEEAKHHGGDLEKEFKRLLISQAVQSKKKRVEEKLVNNFWVGLERYFLTTLTFNIYTLLLTKLFFKKI
jgi:hypothetical protein